MDDLFENDIKNQIEKNVQKLDDEEIYQNEKNKRIMKYRNLEEFLSLYLNSYYDVLDLNLHSKYSSAQQVLKDPFFIENYDSEIQQKVREKSEELKKIQRNYRTVTYKVSIKDGKKIKYMRENIPVTPYQKKLLDIFIAYTKCYGNIRKTVEYLKNQGFKYSYCYIESSLKSEELKQILSEENLLNLEGYYKAEKVLQGAVISNKRQLVEDVLTLFYTYNGNLFKILEKCDMNIGLLFRILTDDMVKNKVGEEKFNQILSVIEAYDDKKMVFDELQKAYKKEK